MLAEQDIRKCLDLQDLLLLQMLGILVLVLNEAYCESVHSLIGSLDHKFLSKCTASEYGGLKSLNEDCVLGKGLLINDHVLSVQFNSLLIEVCQVWTDLLQLSLELSEH